MDGTENEDLSFTITKQFETDDSDTELSDNEHETVMNNEVHNSTSRLSNTQVAELHLPLLNSPGYVSGSVDSEFESNAVFPIGLQASHELGNIGLIKQEPIWHGNSYTTCHEAQTKSNGFIKEEPIWDGDSYATCHEAQTKCNGCIKKEPIWDGDSYATCHEAQTKSNGFIKEEPIWDGDSYDSCNEAEMDIVKQEPIDSEFFDSYEMSGQQKINQITACLDNESQNDTVKIKQEPFDSVAQNNKQRSFSSGELYHNLNGQDFATNNSGVIKDELLHSEMSETSPIKQEPIDYDTQNSEPGTSDVNTNHNAAYSTQICDETMPLNMDSTYLFKSEHGHGSFEVSQESNSICLTDLDIDRGQGLQSNTCSFCSITFPTSSMLSQHLINHQAGSDLTEYHCDFMCGKSFDSLSQYIMHLRVHTLSRRFKCDQCSKSFHSKSLLIVHYRKHTGEKPFGCATCGKRFAAKSHCNRHQLTHTEEIPLICKFCNKHFRGSDGSGLAKHWEEEHQGQNAYKCEHCGQEFNDITRFIQHHKAHGTSREKQLFCCKLCDKRFGDARMLAIHAQTHNGEYPYSCHLCLKGFMTKSLLINHARTHTNEKPFGCPICGKMFATKGQCVFHQAYHGDMASMCEKCGKEILTNINDHWAMEHADEKPYQCATCGKDFANISSFVKHNKTHHKHQCQVCKKEFPYKLHLTEHQKMCKPVS